MHYVQLKYSYLLTAHQSGYAELGFANAPESTSSTLFVKKWNRFFLHGKTTSLNWHVKISILHSVCVVKCNICKEWVGNKVNAIQ